MKGELRMHLCDKCVKFNKCYKRGSWPTAEQREAIELSGCKDYKELTVKSMFMNEERKKRNEGYQRSKR